MIPRTISTPNQYCHSNRGSPNKNVNLTEEGDTFGSRNVALSVDTSLRHRQGKDTPACRRKQRLSKVKDGDRRQLTEHWKDTNNSSIQNCSNETSTLPIEFAQDSTIYVREQSTPSQQISERSFTWDSNGRTQASLGRNLTDLNRAPFGTELQDGSTSIVDQPVSLGSFPSPLEPRAQRSNTDYSMSAMCTTPESIPQTGSIHWASNIPTNSQRRSNTVSHSENAILNTKSGRHWNAEDPRPHEPLVPGQFDPSEIYHDAEDFVVVLGLKLHGQWRPWQFGTFAENTHESMFENVAKYLGQPVAKILAIDFLVFPPASNHNGPDEPKSLCTLHPHDRDGFLTCAKLLEDQYNKTPLTGQHILGLKPRIAASVRGFAIPNTQNI